ncbi:MAG: radical SAM family heme chaperone HemW [Anaerolineaceae bacterium]|nr:radical SAM family heme chaperone HemW [Anaerolineaceae bacterium]
MQSSNLLSIYIHIPFCRTRCGYCDFNTYTGYDYLKEAYVNAMIEEIARTSANIDAGFLVHTIYFGGGTPNLLTPGQFEDILNSIRKNFPVVSEAEISTEANPTCLPGEYLSALRDFGINRLSFGMQSASAKELKILGRMHTFEDLKISVENARNAGISNFNLDLIFGISYQTLLSFEDSMKSALGLSPNHLSLYALSIEDSTPLAIKIANKQLTEPDEDLAADMYILAMEYLEKNGFSQYEISNWSLDEQSQCLHNLQYWRNLDYLGFGAGAHSHYNQLRWENHKTITDYIGSVSQRPQNRDCFSPAGTNLISLNTNDEMSETMMMGMRLTTEGINAEDFVERFGVRLDEVYSKEITKMYSQGLVEWVELEGCKHLRLTHRGRLLGNQVFMQFIRD